jgi:hypothetical protein
MSSAHTEHARTPRAARGPRPAKAAHHMSRRARGSPRARSSSRWPRRRGTPRARRPPRAARARELSPSKSARGVALRIDHALEEAVDDQHREHRPRAEGGDHPVISMGSTVTAAAGRDKLRTRADAPADAPCEPGPALGILRRDVGQRPERRAMAGRAHLARPAWGCSASAYIDLAPHLDLSALPRSTRRCASRSRRSPSTHGRQPPLDGHHAPSREAEALVDYVEVIRAMSDAEFATLRSLADDPRAMGGCRSRGRRLRRGARGPRSRAVRWSGSRCGTACTSRGRGTSR